MIWCAPGSSRDPQNPVVLHLWEFWQILIWCTPGSSGTGPRRRRGTALVCKRERAAAAPLPPHRSQVARRGRLVLLPIPLRRERRWHQWPGAELTRFSAASICSLRLCLPSQGDVVRELLLLQSFTRIPALCACACRHKAMQCVSCCSRSPESLLSALVLAVTRRCSARAVAVVHQNPSFAVRELLQSFTRIPSLSTHAPPPLQ